MGNIAVTIWPTPSERHMKIQYPISLSIKSISVEGIHVAVEFAFGAFIENSSMAIIAWAAVCEEPTTMHASIELLTCLSGISLKHATLLTQV